MPKLDTISGIPAKAIELLEALGYLDVSDLRDADVKSLIAELVKANKVLEIMPDDPSESILKKWLKLANEQDESAGKVSSEKAAKKNSGKGQGAQSDDSEAGTSEKQKSAKKKPAPKKPAKRELVNFEKDTDMMQMLSLSPVAEPLDPLLMADEDLSMDDITDGILLNQCEDDVKINIMTTLGRADSLFRKDEVERAGLNSSRIRNFDDLDSTVQYVKPLDRGPQKEAVTLSEELNQGVDSRSRKFIKGVFHTQVKTVRIAAVTAILFVAILVINIASLLGLFFYRTNLEAGVVMGWVMGLLLLLIITAATYVYFGTRARCVVCRQPPLMPKKCIKHKKAHHVKGIGYILPTALQLLVYKWFYCTYCGTALRLKK
ncbi:MAG: hypothetical protein GWP68_08075 [Verrucomicrobiaceae bacterium]|nr:hypothetical protein [Verrucomicrobiaceae bacterium]